MIESLAELAETFMTAIAGRPTSSTIYTFPEGRAYERLHRTKERSQRLAKLAKQHRQIESGKLECDVCGFDFERCYGPIGRGFIEMHHLLPVAALRGEVKSSIDDLALVCSNCHRMLHRYRPWLTRKRLHLLLARGSR